MGSVTRRFRRNIQAKNLALKIGVLARPLRVGKKLYVPGMNVPLIHYRRTMLFHVRNLRERFKREHDLWQKEMGIRSKRKAFYGAWRKSWLRRMLEKIFPSLNEEYKRAVKEERERKRQLRKLDPVLRRVMDSPKPARKE